jgi:hypothetical protein
MSLSKKQSSVKSLDEYNELCNLYEKAYHFGNKKQSDEEYLSRFDDID